MNSKTMLESLRSIKLARQSMEILIAETPCTDECSLGQLGPILADLRSNEAVIQWLWECNSKSINLLGEMQDYTPANACQKI